MKERINVYIASNSPHTSQVVTGFLMLQKKGIVRIRFIHNQYKNARVLLPHEHVVLAYVKDKVLLFDMADGYNFRSDFDLQSCLRIVDSYFKRSFSKKRNAELVRSEEDRSRVFPLGFNYHVTYPQNPLDSPVSLRTKLLNLRYKVNKDNQFYPSDFEQDVMHLEGTPRIVFFSRLWDPLIEKSFTAEELNYINGTRISIVRQLKRTYKESFIGGIQTEIGRASCRE